MLTGTKNHKSTIKKGYICYIFLTVWRYQTRTINGVDYTGILQLYWFFAILVRHIFWPWIECYLHVLILISNVRQVRNSLWSLISSSSSGYYHLIGTGPYHVIVQQFARNHRILYHLTAVDKIREVRASSCDRLSLKIEINLTMTDWTAAVRCTQKAHLVEARGGGASHMEKIFP